MAIRLSVQFDAQLSQTLEQMAKKKGITKTEIIRRVIATYRTLDQETKGSKNVSITEGYRIVKQMILP